MIFPISFPDFYKKTKDIVYTKAKKAEVFFILENIVVFLGGVSTERDISVITGILTLNCLDKAKYNAVAVYISDSGKFYISDKFSSIENFKKIDYSRAKQVTFVPGDNHLYVAGKKLVPLFQVDCVINCLHGKNGEDGTLGGYLKMCDIPFASPDMFASSFCIDKDLSKIILKGLDVPFVDYIRVKKQDFFKKSRKFLDFIIKKLGLPVIIKPACLGSSIGIKVAENENQLFSFLSDAFAYDNKVICEKYISGARDINIALYYGQGKINISLPEEAVSTENILSFEDKYGGGGKTAGSDRIFPAKIKPELYEKMKTFAERVYRKCDFLGIVRFDFLLKDETVYMNEINTVPGSMAYYLFCNKFSEFTVLLDDLIEEGKKRSKGEHNCIRVFESDILSGNFKSIKK